MPSPPLGLSRAPALALCALAACLGPDGGSSAGLSVSDGSGTPILREEVLPADVGPAPFRWHDRRFGFDVHSDFPRDQIEPWIERRIHPGLLVCAQVFQLEDLSPLYLRLHDIEPVARGGYRINGFHDGEEVHIFAGRGPDSWRSGPHPHSRATLVHELVHACVFLAGRELPRWLEEGLCELLARGRIRSDGALVLDLEEAVGPRVAFLFEQGLVIPTGELTDFLEGYPEDEDMRAFYTQAAGFLAFLLSEQRGQLDERLEALLGMEPEQLEAAGGRWLLSLGL